MMQNLKVKQAALAFLLLLGHQVAGQLSLYARKDYTNEAFLSEVSFVAPNRAKHNLRAGDESEFFVEIANKDNRYYSSLLKFGTGND